jgi:3-methyladenine DNA glycosylase/8-oxoguanine DNA glycosylase
VARSPELLGLHDADPATIQAALPPGLVREAHRRRSEVRMSASRAVVEALVPTILEQKVTSIEAHRAFRALLRRYGAPAPGPAGDHGLRLRPDPAVLARVPYHELHRLGIERRRADTIRRTCARADRLDALAATAATGDLAAVAGAAQRVLATIPGIGAWTTSIIAQQAFGDPDAVIVGDFHLPNLVAWNLAGEPRATDARMLELLEPYRGQRGRAVRLIGGAGTRAPAFGPKHELRSIAAI